jgi:acetyl-CoA carboxylase biotin carboxyl carrier protein
MRMSGLMDRGYCPPRFSAIEPRGTPRLPNQEAHRVTDVEAHITGTVWKIECEVGDEIEEGDTVAVLESMKMEMPVEAEDAGTVTEIRCEEGQAVNEGDTLVVLE